MIFTIIYSLKASNCIQEQIRPILMMKFIEKADKNTYPTGIILENQWFKNIDVNSLKT